MNYFGQILLHDLTPLSRPLILNKILIVVDEPSIESPEKSSDDISPQNDSKTGGDILHSEVTDYSKITENLFFRIYEGTAEEEILMFDQLDQNSKIDAATGMP